MGSFGILALLGGAFAGCAGPSSEDVTALDFPPSASFEPVGEALQAHCGSLDCHGQMGRNLRLYGANGLRLSPRKVPGGGVTTTAELAENYRSVLALEPELTALVIGEGGQRPERLTLVRKGRGSEHHKGGRAMEPEGPADRCVASWLARRLDVEACAEAAEYHRPAEAEPAP